MSVSRPDPPSRIVRRSSPQPCFPFHPHKLKNFAIDHKGRLKGDCDKFADAIYRLAEKEGLDPVMVSLWRKGKRGMENHMIVVVHGMVSHNQDRFIVPLQELFARGWHIRYVYKGNREGRIMDYQSYMEVINGK